MSDPAFRLGARRTSETLTEVLVPLSAAVASWFVARRVLATPSASHVLSPAELTAILGAVTAIFAWYTVRQLGMFNVRRPAIHVGWAIGACASALYALSAFVAWGFEARCLTLGGEITTTTTPGMDPATVCQLTPVPDNVYLPGTLLRPPWDGTWSPPLVIALTAIALLAAVGLRNVRLRRTRMGTALVDELTMAPAAGSAAVNGGDGADGIQACGNPTLWGEPCGQLYPAEKTFEPGEWCVRCAQVYQRNERTLVFTVVSLFTGDIDVLNGLERIDASSWPQGEPPPPDARLSGQERWVKMGRIEVPDVLTVGTLLALVHERLDKWAGDAPDHAQKAFKLATDRGSRLAAWIWFGHHDHALTYARPTERALLALAPMRLRDLALEVGEELVLQLDIGLLPLELRTGFRQTFLDPARTPVVHNAKQDFWIPVAGAKAQQEGLWVPRIEGEALRAWLSLDRLRDDDVRGVTSPRPYAFKDDDPTVATPGEGVLDLVRMPIEDGEPQRERLPGAAISEWAWMERRHIELLRQQALVMVGPS